MACAHRTRPGGRDSPRRPARLSSADLVLADTTEDADFFSRETRVQRIRFRVLSVGAQEDVFRPHPEVEPEPRLVFFHGTYIPLHGIETIVRAAKILEPEGIRFRIVGDGQERSTIEKLVRNLDPTNLELDPPVPLDRLPQEIARGSLCLGIFGATPKADRVIPNKIFEYLAVGRPVVTANTAAIRSAFADELAVVPAGDPDALAATISNLLTHPDRLAELAASGHARYRRDFSEDALSRVLAGHLTALRTG